jgi:hypothetical protein
MLPPTAAIRRFAAEFSGENVRCDHPEYDAQSIKPA